jgi:hypothetical protein
MPSLNTPLRILFVGVVATPVERGFAGLPNLLCRFLIAFYSETIVLPVIDARDPTSRRPAALSQSLRLAVFSVGG